MFSALLLPPHHEAVFLLLFIVRFLAAVPAVVEEQRVPRLDTARQPPNGTDDVLTGRVLPFWKFWIISECLHVFWVTGPPPLDEKILHRLDVVDAPFELQACALPNVVDPDEERLHPSRSIRSARRLVG